LENARRLAIVRIAGDSRLLARLQQRLQARLIMSHGDGEIPAAIA